MNEPIAAVGSDWSALRRRFAGEALANVLAFCGCSSHCRGREGSGEGLLLTADASVLSLPVGPVALLWGGAPLEGSTPDWPRRVAPNAARFFLTARPLAEPVTLDCNLAARRDSGNPCYHACYTHKRLRTLLSRWSPDGLSDPAPFTGEGRALALAIDRFPAAVRRAAEGFDPYFVNRYALELAGEIRCFLRACPPAAENRPLLAAAETALGNALGILMRGAVR